MAYLFDFDNALIEITAPQIEVAIQDLLNAIRTAEVSEIGIIYGQIARASGKESLGSGVAVGISLELLGNWQLRFWEGNYIAKIAGGNLVGGPSGDPVAYTAGVQVLLIQSAASTVVQVSDGGPLTTEQAAKLMSLPVLSQIESSAVLAKQPDLIRALGLMQENYCLDQCVYVTFNGQKLLTSGRIRTYSDAASVGTDANILAAYAVQSSWTEDAMTSYKVAKL